MDTLLLAGLLAHWLTLWALGDGRGECNLDYRSRCRGGTSSLALLAGLYWLARSTSLLALLSARVLLDWGCICDGVHLDASRVTGGHAGRLALWLLLLDRLAGLATLLLALRLALRNWLLVGNTGVVALLLALWCTLCILLSNGNSNLEGDSLCHSLLWLLLLLDALRCASGLTGRLTLNWSRSGDRGALDRTLLVTLRLALCNRLLLLNALLLALLLALRHA